MRISAIKNNQGNALIMTLIGSLILGIVISGMASFMSQLSLRQATTQRKGDYQNLETLIRTSMLNQESCETALRLKENPTINEGLLNINDTALNGVLPSAPLTLPVTSIKIAGDTLTKNCPWGAPCGTTDPKLTTVGDITIDLRAETSLGSHQFVGWLNTNVTSKVGDTPVDKLLRAPIWIKFEKTAPNSTTYNVASCMISSGEADAEKTCTDLGGRWLDSSPNKGIFRSYNGLTTCTPIMSKPRCSFGNTISLAPDEVPSGVSCDGSASIDSAANTNGERATTCFYQKNNSTAVLQYACRTKSSGDANKCVFNSQTKLWELARYKGTPNTYRNKIQSCDKGVEVSRIADSQISCAYDEGLKSCAENNSDKISNIPSSGWTPSNATIRLLPAVSRCYTDAASDLYYECINPTDNEAAFEGRTKSCVFENGYWMYVTSSRDYDYTTAATISSAATTKYCTGGVSINASAINSDNFETLVGGSSSEILQMDLSTRANQKSEMYCKLYSTDLNTEFAQDIIKCNNHNITSVIYASNPETYFNIGNICWKINSNVKTSLKTSATFANDTQVVLRKISANQTEFEGTSNLRLKDGTATVLTPLGTIASNPNFLPCAKIYKKGPPPPPAP